MPVKSEGEVALHLPLMHSIADLLVWVLVRWMLGMRVDSSTPFSPSAPSAINSQ